MHHYWRWIRISRLSYPEFIEGKKALEQKYGYELSDGVFVLALINEYGNLIKEIEKKDDEILHLKEENQNYFNEKYSC